MSEIISSDLDESQKLIFWSADFRSSVEDWHLWYLEEPWSHQKARSVDMTLTVAEALSPYKPNLEMTLAVTEALSPNKPNLDMTLAVAGALSPNTPNQTFI